MVAVLSGSRAARRFVGALAAAREQGAKVLDLLPLRLDQQSLRLELDRLLADERLEAREQLIDSYLSHALLLVYKVVLHEPHVLPPLELVRA